MYKRQGFETVPEPGRRIVAEEMRGAGKALPWVDLGAFARSAIELALRDRERVKRAKGWVFFDRGLVDGAVALEHAGGVTARDTLSGQDPFHRQMFRTPPGPEIYRMDDERQHSMEEGIDEYHRLLDAFDQLGYETIVLPKVDVAARADFILERLS